MELKTEYKKIDETNEGKKFDENIQPTRKCVQSLSTFLFLFFYMLNLQDD